jgi:hypothetical protein
MALYPVAHYSSQSILVEYLKEAGPCRAERLFACRSLPSLPTGLCLESACCQQDSRCQSSAPNSVSSSYPPNLIAGHCLAIRGVHPPDWASAVRRNPDSRLTPARRGQCPNGKPRCTYYLVACLEQGKKATRLKQDPPSDLALQPLVLPSIASKHLETLLTGACKTLVASYWLSNSGRHFSPVIQVILGRTDAAVDSSSIRSIG